MGTVHTPRITSTALLLVDQARRVYRTASVWQRSVSATRARMTRWLLYGGGTPA